MLIYPLFVYFIGNSAQQPTVFTSKNDSFATIDVHIPDEHKCNINILISENESCISESILNKMKK